MKTRSHPRRLTLKLSGVALAMAALQTPAMAVDYVWNGSNGFWDESAKWSLLGVPGSGDSATVNGTGTNSLIVRDPRSVDTLFLNGGNLASTSTLSVGTLDFGSGKFGTSQASAGGVMNVTGSAVFNGSENQGVEYSHVLNLGGNASWTQGNGRLSVATSYSQGSQSFASAVLNIGAGTVFTDEGAATASAYKQLGGGTVNNSGTYVRRGLGETFAQSVNNTGTIDIRSGTFSLAGNGNGSINNSSSGQILVASGTTLKLDSVNFTGGSVVNNGLVRQYAGTVVLGAGVQIGGAWQIDAGRMTVQGTHTVDSLVMSGTDISGPGTLNTGSLVFNYGKFGSTSSQGGGVMNVTGSAVFDGTSNQSIEYSHVVNLSGDTSWTKGNGRLAVSSAYTQSQTYPSAVLNIGAGTTFTDEGAASASGYKQLGGGTVNNSGTYVRRGLGETFATSFNNTGTIDVQSGTFSLAGNGNGSINNSSSGQILVASGTTLKLDSVNFTGGSVVNNGLVRQYAGTVVLGAGVQIGGAWQIDAGRMTVQGTHTIDSLVMSGTDISGPGTLNTGSLVFNYGKFGSTSSQGGGVMNVTGSAVFNGSENQGVDYSHVLNLGGNASWTQGNGRLSVATSYSQGSQSFASAVLNIGAGTVFTDEGAASASGYKQLGGGTVNNSGTYVRRGLGETFAQSVNNTGTIDIRSGTFSLAGNGNGSINNSSSGQILVASGSTLKLDSVNFTGGSVVNNGLVRQYAGTVVLGAGVQIGGAWQIDAGRMTVQGTHTIDSLVMSGTDISGPGTLNTGSLVFNYGKFGSTSSQGGGVMNVTGSAVFDGTQNQGVDYSHVLNLAGSATWTQGNGRLTAASAYSQGSQTYAAAALNIGTGTVFTDAGAATAAGTKTAIGLSNAGTYVRSGAGTTEATGFNNTGSLQIVSGTFSVDDRFSNTGQVDVAAGAQLSSYRSLFANAGLLTGAGTVKTYRATDALLSSGTIDPGTSSAAPAGLRTTLGAAGSGFGTLTIDGGLSLTDSAVLHIDLGANGASDLLAVTGSALWNGELSIWATPGTSLQLGETFTIATAGQRLSNSSFDSISWHGLSAGNFAIDYTADGITLRVTAVPEPASYALLALGLLVIGARKWRRQIESKSTL